MRPALVFSLLVFVVAPASADVIGPEDHLCTLELQQQDGSQCEECEFFGAAPQGEPNDCDPLRERGLHHRCSVGATHARSIYCDREADFVEVGEGGCGCRVGQGRPTAGWLLGLLGLVLWRRGGQRGS